ncbi:unnamed protein product [Prorocentrum cordatum]|uniref:Amine oxidase n=1 Tax=Prorocentrum cordatum TaxID=2364126 RepID=A0ABN9WWX0_9DINO|nr:unnamed protein product [Polarella glacialis]
MQRAGALPPRSVCVIGGGPAGLGCCAALRGSGVRVTLIQESRGMGGKLCTKFAGPGEDDPTLHFDMGVQLLRPRGALAEALGGEGVAPWPEDPRGAWWSSESALAVPPWRGGCPRAGSWWACRPCRPWGTACWPRAARRSR